MSGVPFFHEITLIRYLETIHITSVKPNIRDQNGEKKKLEKQITAHFDEVRTLDMSTSIETLMLVIAIIYMDGGKMANCSRKYFSHVSPHLEIPKAYTVAFVFEVKNNQNRLHEHRKSK